MSNEHRHSPRSLWCVTASKLPYTGKKSGPKPKPKVLKSEISFVNEHPVLRKSTINKNGEILGSSNKFGPALTFDNWIQF